MSATDLASILTTLENSEPNKTSFDESWSQGRSAFGGLASAFAVTSMRKLLDSNKPIRSLMVSFIGPLPPGEVQVNASVQRQGKNVTQLVADVCSNDEVCLQAMGVFGNPREGVSIAPEYPFSPPPKDSGIPFEKYAKRQPSFLKYFEGFWASEGLPFSGRPVRQLQMWLRQRGDVSGFPIENIVTIADMPPPVILSHYDKPPVPASSLTWSLEFLIPPEKITSEWFYLEYSIEAAAEGYTQQSGRVFTEDGQLCALSRQCMVYFAPQSPSS